VASPSHVRVVAPDERPPVKLKTLAEVSLDAMPRLERRLRWIPESAAKLVHHNGIHRRSGLAETTGLGRPTVYQSFMMDCLATASLPCLPRWQFTSGFPSIAW
jgi:hypothetical protein